MKKNKESIIYVCENCGNEFARWSGRCSACGQWNSLKEIKKEAETDFRPDLDSGPSEIISLSELKSKRPDRIKTGFTEVDRVLGGGIVPGEIILLAGSPGIGKSTLLLQLSGTIGNVLYISGEELPEQIKLRADRTKIRKSNLKLLNEINLRKIIKHIDESNPKLVVIDSVQVIFDPSFPSMAGSLIQVRESAAKLQQVAKQKNVPIILVGHVTKEGSVAGPRTLEHIVDTVLYFEGDKYHGTRILRTEKNRFGATDEIGVFEMVQSGLKEITNPSKIFLDKKIQNVPGSCITATLEGTRSFLVEIQALTSKTIFGYPKRTTSGIDWNRLQMIIAVLTKFARINLSDQDVYVNAVGGFILKEPAADLAIAIAIVSAFKAQPVKNNICAFGEVGLSGEIRKPLQIERRIKEAKRLGYGKIILSTRISAAINEALKSR
jgi:DNA repair protein RadA/Sms